MKFYFQDNDGNRRELTADELREHMSEYNIREAIEAKQADPHEEVSYMTVGGFIICEMDEIEQILEKAERDAARAQVKKLMESHEKWKAEHPRPKHSKKKEDDTMTAKELQRLEQIARENIAALENRQDLEAHNNDSEDFFETSVWSLKAALIAAYELGKKEAKA